MDTKYRLQLTRDSGEVILGPFVYDFSEEEMRKKVNKMNWVCYKEVETDEGIRRKKVSELTFFPVTNYPKIAVFNPDSGLWDRMEDTLDFIKHLEDQWNNLTKGEEDEE